MAIETNISDMPWLNQPNPGEFLLKSQAVANDTARMVQSSFNAGAERARLQRRDDALLPLQQMEMNNQLKSQALDIKGKMLFQEMELQKKQAGAHLAHWMAATSKAGAWGQPEAKAEFFSFMEKNPDMMDTPLAKQAMGLFERADIAREKQAELNARMLDSQLDRGSAEYRAEIDAQARKDIAANRMSAQGDEADRRKTSMDIFESQLRYEHSSLEKQLQEGLISQPEYQRKKGELDVKLKDFMGGRQTGGGEQRKMLKNGREAIFDMNRNFLRYADE